MRLAAAEEADEEILKMLVDLMKGRQQPVPALAVEAGDTLPEPLDRGLQIGPFPGHGVELFAELVGLLFGAEVDGTHPFPLAEQPLEAPRRLLERRRCG